MSERTREERRVVLVADDDEMLRAMAREALADDFHVLAAGNGREAVELFDACEPDAVLLDVVMPEMDGFEACARIRTHPRGALTPILMMTVSDDEESIQKAYDLGATDFEPKPINYLILRHRIHYLLKARSTLGALKQSEHRLKRAQTTARIGIWEYDAEADSLLVYEDASGILGVDVDAGTRLRADALFEQAHPDDRVRLESLFESARRDGRGFKFQYRVRPNSDESRHVFLDVEVDRSDGGLTLNGVAQDITEIKLAEQRSFELAYYDVLTKLPNRNYLMEHLPHLLQASGKERNPVTLFSLDLDDFKRINDSLGQEAGDRFLVEVSRRLAGAVRLMDRRRFQAAGIAARRGDDEFLLAIQNLKDESKALAFGKDLLEHLAEPVRIEGQELCVSASIGIARFPEHGSDAAELVKNAQTAMNEAKRLGRNRCTFFRPRLNDFAAKRLSLEQAIRHGLEEEQFRMLYQPKVDVRTGMLASVEALIRWEHPKVGVVSPGEFLPVAEETGLIVPMGRWVLNDVCRQMRAWCDQGTPIAVSVNVSGLQFERSDLAQSVSAALSQAGVSPELLEIELTEGILLEDNHRVRESLQSLEKIGVRIALDDFGTGYSSLSYLKKFPIHVVKIDRSFVSDLGASRDSAAIVSAIIALARGLDLDVVAEGVETRAQADFLVAKGCVRHQGFLFAKPLTPRELERWLEGRGPAPDHLEAPSYSVA